MAPAKKPDEPAPGVQIAKVISAWILQYPNTTPEALTSIISGISSCLATMAVAHFGRERAPAEISAAINAALLEVGKITDEIDKQEGWNQP